MCCLNIQEGSTKNQCIPGDTSGLFTKINTPAGFGKEERNRNEILYKRFCHRSFSNPGAYKGEPKPCSRVGSNLLIR